MASTNIEVMVPVQAGLEELKKRADYVEVSSSIDGWQIEIKIQDITIIETHANLWYLVNLGLDKMRPNLVFTKPVPSDDFEVGKWQVYNPPLSFQRICRCGATATKIRGWSQKGTPCRLSEFMCKHGHQWTSSINCD